MGRALFYLAQISGLVLLTGWLLGQDGRVDATFGPYHISGQSGITAVLCLILVFLLLMIHRVWLWITRLPRTWKRYRRDVHLIKGHRALTHALSALAAGDYRIAETEAIRAQKLLPEFGAVPTILVAATAQKLGHHVTAQGALQKLMQTEARDLGVRGLVNAAIAEGKWDHALSIAQHALDQQPRTLMLQRLVYDLECRTGQFERALARQKILIRRKGISPETATRDRVMLMTAIARDLIEKEQHKRAYRFARKAFDLDPGFTPAACDLIDLYRGFGKTRAALRTLARAVRAAPHPDLTQLHEQMAPQAKNLARRMRYHEKFLSLRPDDVGAQLMLARIAMSEGMMGEARAYLSMAEKLDPSQMVYRALADYAEKAGDASAAHDALAKGMSAAPDPVWFCTRSGMRYPTWQPIVLPTHDFGTVIWGRPDATPALPAAPSVQGLLG